MGTCSTRDIAAGFHPLRQHNDATHAHAFATPAGKQAALGSKFELKEAIQLRPSQNPSRELQAMHRSFRSPNCTRLPLLLQHYRHSWHSTKIALTSAVI